MRVWRWALISAAVFTSGCLEVAAERARMDATVGRAQNGGDSANVSEGLASVQALEGGQLTLWANAPAFELALESGTGGQWVLTVENAMSDATLIASVNGEPLATQSLDSDRPTLKRWQFSMPPSSRARLRLSTADAGQTTPFNYVVFADVQGRIDGVQDIYRRMNEEEVRFGLISGDLTERGSNEELARFKREMRTLNFPLFATLGNHELGTDEFNFHRHFGRGSSSFVFRGVRFTMLDSASATLAPQVYDWLGGWLADGEGGLHMVIMHHPPLDPDGKRNGAFASRSEANKLLSTLARGGVDLTVYGHVHSFYTFENAGIEAFISGGGGAIPQRLDGVGRHFLKILADPASQRMTTGIVRISPAD